MAPVQSMLRAFGGLVIATAAEATPTRLPSLQVVAPQSAGTTTTVDGQQEQSTAPARQASDLLTLVPGIAVRDRGNAAQDLQVQSRGFGARANFGIRGLRLTLDDVPLSANDGQGSLGNWLLPTLGRIDALRGPQALMLGNAAGGGLAAQIAEPHADVGKLSLAGGSDGNRLLDLGWMGLDDARQRAWRVDVRSMRSEGARPHSAFERHQAQLWMRGGTAEGAHWRWFANVLDAPRAQDPLGLTPTQWHDGVAVDPAALRFNTRKALRDGLLGGRLDFDVADALQASAVMHVGQRDVRQFLALPVAAQAAPGSAGGVIELRRDRAGVVLMLARERASGSWRGGVELSQTDEQRRGYENFSGQTLGVIGALRRDERNRIDGLDWFASYAHPLPGGQALTMGLRRSTLHLRTRDRFFANGDDSGSRRFASTDASLSWERQSKAGGRRWLALGSGYEAPTLNELAYRSDGASGLNDALAAAKSVMFDAGLSESVLGGQASVSAYVGETRDDIVPAINRGGRASFRNADRVTRRGVEMAFDRNVGQRLHVQLAASWIDARFARGFSYSVPGDSAPREVRDGARVPGVAARQFAVDLRWNSADARSELRASFLANSSLPADDRGTVKAPGSARVDLSALRRLVDGVELTARVDNVLDRNAIGSVIVNESNGRYFEPAAGRTFWLGLNWSGPR